MLQPYLIEADGRYFELSQREGNALVSFTFGVITTRQIIPHLANAASDLTHYLLWETNDCRFRAEKLLAQTGLFKPGSQSIYWIKPDEEYLTVFCWTPALVPDTLPLERVFEVMKVSNLHPDSVWTEVARLAETRAALGLLKAA